MVSVTFPERGVAVVYRHGGPGRDGVHDVHVVLG